jgi:hypothetical protein
MRERARRRLGVGMPGHSMTTRYSAGWARTVMPLMRCCNSEEAAALQKWSADLWVPESRSWALSCGFAGDAIRPR